MSQLQKIIYLTREQYDKLQNNEDVTAGGITLNGIDENNLYFITDETISSDELGDDFILPVKNGGTGKTQFTTGSLLVGNGQNALTEIGATDQNTANTIVKRDSNGGFSMGALTATKATINGTVLEGKKLEPLNQINSDGGNMILGYKKSGTGVSTSQWCVGTVDIQGVIRSNNSDLLHSRNGTNSVILDAGNYASYIKYVNLYEARSSTTTLNKTANYVAAGAMFHLVASSSTSATDNGKTPMGDANILQMNWDSNGGYDAQLGIHTTDNRMEFRSRASQKQAWREVVTSTPETAAGGETQPVYINTSGIATAISYTIAKSVPSDAVFTDHYAWSDITGKPTKITLTGAVTGNVSLSSGELSLTTSVNHDHDTSYLTAVGYDSTNKKLYYTKNGSNTDVVTVATLKSDLGSMPPSAHDHDDIYCIPYRSGRNFVNGTLITTNLSGGTTSSSIPFHLIIYGNGYGDGVVHVEAQGYIYQLGNGHNNYINTSALSTGQNFANKIYAFSNSEGKLCFWFERIAYWQGFDVICQNTSDKNNQLAKNSNRVISITDAALPAENARSWTTEITVQQVIHSSNISSQSVNYAISAAKFASAQSITLTGDVTGTASSQAGWSLATTIETGKVTNAMLAGSINNDKLANSKVIIAGNEVSLGGSLSDNTLRESLGLSKALRFIGVTTTDMTGGTATNHSWTGTPAGISNYTPKQGDVVINSTKQDEWVCTSVSGTTYTWERLGSDTSYKIVQSAVSDPTASTTTSTTFIDTISQNANGVITATKKTLPTASSTVAGITTVGASGGAAAYSHTHGYITNGGLLNTASMAVVTDSSKKITTADLSVSDSNASTSATTTFVQAVTQNAQGKITVTKASLNTSGEWDGNAGTATKLAASKTLWGQSFDGSANVTGNLIDVGNQIKLLSGQTELQFLTSSGGAANGKFGKLGLNTTYANVDFTNYTLDVNGKARIGALDGGQHVINGNVQLNAQSGSYNEGLRINRSTTGYANIYLGGTRSSASGNQTGGWWIGTLSTPANATSNGDAITNTVFTISNNNTSDTLSIKGTRGTTIGTNSGWAIRPRLAVGTTYNTSYNLYVNGTSYLNGNTTINGNLIPGGNNTKTLGSTDVKWAQLYVGAEATYGDEYTPIYWNNGVPAAVTLTQQCDFTINSGTSGVRLSHSAITINSYVTQIVVKSGEANLNSAISWTSADGYIELTCSKVSGNVSGYIMISRGGKITATATDIT